jgi:hypothetical protein
LDRHRLAVSLDLKLAVPAGFLFGFKVTGTLAIKKFPNLPRFSVRAEQMNQDFLNSELFTTADWRLWTVKTERSTIVVFIIQHVSVRMGLSQIPTLTTL